MARYLGYAAFKSDPRTKHLYTRWCKRCNSYYKSETKNSKVCLDCNQAIGMPWSNMGAFIVGFLALLLVGIFTCSYKFALLAGIVGAFVGAYFGGSLFGEGGY